MDTFGSAIHRRIDELYQLVVDVKAPAYQSVLSIVDQTPRPLIGKQRHAAAAGAGHLKRNSHLNLFATQGSGKTGTAAAIARAMGCRKVGVITHSSTGMKPSNPPAATGSAPPMKRWTRR